MSDYIRAQKMDDEPITFDHFSEIAEYDLNNNDYDENPTIDHFTEIDEYKFDNDEDNDEDIIYTDLEDLYDDYEDEYEDTNSIDTDEDTELQLAYDSDSNEDAATPFFIGAIPLKSGLEKLDLNEIFNMNNESKKFQVWIEEEDSIYEINKGETEWKHIHTYTKNVNESYNEDINVNKYIINDDIEKDDGDITFVSKISESGEGVDKVEEAMNHEDDDNIQDYNEDEVSDSDSYDYTEHEQSIPDNDINTESNHNIVTENIENKYQEYVSPSTLSQEEKDYHHMVTHNTGYVVQLKHAMEKIDKIARFTVDSIEDLEDKSILEDSKFGDIAKVDNPKRTYYCVFIGNEYVKLDTFMNESTCNVYHPMLSMKVESIILQKMYDYDKACRQYFITDIYNQPTRIINQDFNEDGDYKPCEFIKILEDDYESKLVMNTEYKDGWNDIDLVNVLYHRFKTAEEMSGNKSLKTKSYEQVMNKLIELYYLIDYSNKLQI